MNNLIVMYHYIRDDNRFNALSVAEFRRQVKLLKKKRLFLTLEQLIDYKGNKPTVTLTFDDGLRDGITNVLPILEENSIKATFFVTAVTIDKGEIVAVQKRHVLMSAIGSKKLISELNFRLPRELKVKPDPMFKTDYLDDLEVCAMKWMLDYADYEIINPILQEIFKKYIKNEGKVFRNLYLSVRDLKVLMDNGMEIGVHGYSHRQLGTATFSIQEEEISKATKILREALKKQPTSFSYPSGSYNPLTVRLLQSNGYKTAVTINKHFNHSRQKLYELGRYDCNDLVNLI